MSCAEDVGDYRPLVSETMEGTGTFNKRLDALFGQLYDPRVDIAVRSGFGVNDGCRDILSELGAAGRKFGARGVVLDRVRELQNLVDERAVSSHLCTPVLCTQSCGQDIMGRWVILLECKAGGNPAHARDSVRNDADVPELVIACLGRIFRGVENSMNAVEMRSQIQLTR
jgi:hypothetical protein